MLGPVTVERDDAYVDDLVVRGRAVEPHLHDDRGGGIRRPGRVQRDGQVQQVDARHPPGDGGVAAGAQHVRQGVGITADQPQLGGDDPLVVVVEADRGPAVE